jgi:hypothetical protein
MIDTVFRAMEFHIFRNIQRANRLCIKIELRTSTVMILVEVAKLLSGEIGFSCKIRSKVNRNEFTNHSSALIHKIGARHINARNYCPFQDSTAVRQILSVN